METADQALKIIQATATQQDGQDLILEQHRAWTAGGAPNEWQSKNNRVYEKSMQPLILPNVQLRAAVREATADESLDTGTEVSHPEEPATIPTANSQVGVTMPAIGTLLKLGISGPVLKRSLMMSSCQKSFG